MFYFARYFIRQFYRQRGLQIASSLAYTTLLSLVPLITVMFGFAGWLPMSETFADSVQSFIFNNFVPSFGHTVQEYIGKFAQNASKLTITGLGVLILIAILLMATIDNALNTIWHVRTRRKPVARFLVYWAILTLGPILIGTGMFSTSYLLSLPGISEMGPWLQLKNRLLSWFPFLTTTVAFALVYVLIPNCHVPRRHAVLGGVIAAILFELAKYSFGIYVKSVPTEAIYGAIAVIPLFLIWIYLSWVIILLGAHITFCLSEFRLNYEIKGRESNDWEFDDAFSLVEALWRGQREGRALALHDLRKLGIRLPQYQINDIISNLQRHKWVDRTSDGNWILTRDLDGLTLMDLHNIVPKRLLVRADGGPGERPPMLVNVMQNYQVSLAESLNVSIGALLRDENTSLGESAE